MEQVILKKKENEIVKLGAYKISVDPIINFMRQTEITNLCIRQCESYGENAYSAVPACKVLFDICVLALQTNLPVEGVKETLVDGVYNLDAQLDYADIEDFVVSGVIEKVKEKVLNYDSVWANILQSIQMFNVKHCIAFIGANLPTAQEMQEQLNNMKNLISENKEFVDKAVKVETANEIYAESVKAEAEQKETAEKEKKTTAKKKKQ